MTLELLNVVWAVKDQLIPCATKSGLGLFHGFFFQKWDERGETKESLIFSEYDFNPLHFRFFKVIIKMVLLPSNSCIGSSLTKFFKNTNWTFYWVYKIVIMRILKFNLKQINWGNNYALFFNSDVFFIPNIILLLSWNLKDISHMEHY